MSKSQKILISIIIMIIIFSIFFITIFILNHKNQNEKYGNKHNEIQKTDNTLIKNNQNQEMYISKENKKINKDVLLQKMEEAENGVIIDEILTNIKELETLAIEFKEQNEIKSTVLELCLQYIRKDNYNNDAWNLAAGNVNEDFVEYIKTNSKLLSNYKFQNVKISNSNVDFVHMCASLNAIVYKNSVLPSEYSGWAGDLVTLMGQIVKYDNNKQEEELIEYGNKLLGANSTNTLFNQKDLIADIDSINISKDNPESFYIAIINYYYKENELIKNREKEFKNYLLEKEKAQSVYEAVKNNFNKNKIYINILLSNTVKTEVLERYKENQEKYIEIIAKTFTNYFEKF